MLWYTLYPPTGLVKDILLFNYHNSEQSSTLSTTLAARMENATGTIDFPFTNDYMFRAALQRNMCVTKALVASLFHLELSEILEISITNPIVLGEAINNKDFILDLRLLLNNSRIINLEMQVLNRLRNKILRLRKKSMLSVSFSQSTALKYQPISKVSAPKEA